MKNNQTRQSSPPSSSLEFPAPDTAASRLARLWGHCPPVVSASEMREGRHVTVHLLPRSVLPVCASIPMSPPHQAKKKDRHLIKCLALSILLLPEFTIVTTAALSQKQTTVRPFHSLPHIATPNTTGTSSFTVMWTPSQP